MRNRIAALVLGAGLVVGIGAALPTPASARPAGVPDVKVTTDSCGRLQVYLNGEPLFLDTQGYCQPPQ